MRTTAQERQFHRGKDARRRGLDRQHPDGRASSASRLAFYAGWDEQDRFMQPKAKPDQLAAFATGLRNLKEWARNL